MITIEVLEYTSTKNDSPLSTYVDLLSLFTLEFHQRNQGLTIFDLHLHPRSPITANSELHQYQKDKFLAYMELYYTIADRVSILEEWDKSMPEGKGLTIDYEKRIISWILLALVKDITTMQSRDSRFINTDPTDKIIHGLNNKKIIFLIDFMERKKEELSNDILKYSDVQNYLTIAKSRKEEALQLGSIMSGGA